MRALSAAAREASAEIRRTNDREDEQMFGDVLSDVASVLWPMKTAANIAALAGCTERCVEFYLAGDREWSGNALAVIVTEILKRHAMRNVKVKAR